MTKKSSIICIWGIRGIAGIIHAIESCACACIVLLTAFAAVSCTEGGGANDAGSISIRLGAFIPEENGETAAQIKARASASSDQTEYTISVAWRVNGENETPTDYTGTRASFAEQEITREFDEGTRVGVRIDVKKGERLCYSGEAEETAVKAGNNTIRVVMGECPIDLTGGLPSGVVIASGGTYKFSGTVSAANVQALFDAIPKTGDAVTIDMSACTCIGGLPELGTSCPLPTDAKVSVLMLPKGITSIPDYFASDLTNDNECLERVVIPDGVTTIGEGAFYHCTRLNTAALPDSITEIKTSAFEGCTNMALGKLPNALNTIGTYAFKGCAHLSIAALPSRITTIEEGAFEGCTGIARLVIPAELKGATVGAYIFASWTAGQTVVVPWANISGTPASWSTGSGVEWYENGHAAVEYTQG